MRLWSIHPRYLDAKGLVALWREGLLAQKVLLGMTRGYRSHPQLVRFRGMADPVAAIGEYLDRVVEEADVRGYHFDRRKITTHGKHQSIEVSDAQADYEFRLLLLKLQTRSPEDYARVRTVARIELHPMFRRAAGPIASWEKVRSIPPEIYSPSGDA